MQCLHDIIKTLYSNQGYLPGYPYHLISDDEMFDAFLREDGFFAEYYPCPDESLQEAYDALLDCIRSNIRDFQENGTRLPDWVYSYMLMQAVTFESPEPEISYIMGMANVDGTELLATFTPELAQACYEISVQWLKKMAYKHIDRPPTMFGESHVIKSLRIDEANVLLDTPEDYVVRPSSPVIDSGESSNDENDTAEGTDEDVSDGSESGIDESPDDENGNFNIWTDEQGRPLGQLQSTESNNVDDQESSSNNESTSELDADKLVKMYLNGGSR